MLYSTSCNICARKYSQILWSCSQTIEKQNCKHQTRVGFVYTYSSTVYTKYKLTKKITEYACNFLDQEFYQVSN